MNIEKFYTNVREYFTFLFPHLLLAFLSPHNGPGILEALSVVDWSKTVDAINVRFLKQNMKNKRIIMSLHFYFFICKT